MATRLERSAPAIKQLKWATWEKRRESARAAMVARIYHEKAPEVLWDLMPPEIKRDMVLRCQTRGELETEMEGEKAFRIWAPRVYNESLRAEIESDSESEECEEEQEENKKIGRQPADEFLLERKGYYGYLSNKYKNAYETTAGEWNVAHTDGSSILINGIRKAGAGVFYGNGNERNVAYAVSGKQTNQRGRTHCIPPVY